ncbi:phosphoribosylformylglycinamidine synthase [Halomonas elongata]|uniref:Phosphoribosylformylglycinamidine synthase n=1 Tax=Halomonas elongata TaxID=2746 RepID=A0A1B8P5T5_HALEL|nr:hypothetical protein [Halomonas elongata]OBX37621.1 phosphoribosylformylglycinamidine synthase [Halomonas elongata]
MLELRGAPALSAFRHAKLLDALRSVAPDVEALEADYVHFVDHDGELADEDRRLLERLLDDGTAREASPKGRLFLVVRGSAPSRPGRPRPPTSHTIAD